MIPYPVPVLAGQGELCKMATDLLISPVLAEKLSAMAQILPFSLSVISAFRTREHQLQLAKEGRPAADPDRSTHCSCPATGVDLRLNGVEPGPYEKALLGEGAVRVGLRWGGGSPAPGGIPVDWNHLDMGPRTT